MHIFGRWKEAEVPGENLCVHRENMRTPHRKAPAVNHKPSFFMVLTPSPLCSPQMSTLFKHFWKGYFYKINNSFKKYQKKMQWNWETWNFYYLLVQYFVRISLCRQESLFQGITLISGLKTVNSPEVARRWHYLRVLMVIWFWLQILLLIKECVTDSMKKSGGGTLRWLSSFPFEALWSDETVSVKQ